MLENTKRAKRNWQSRDPGNIWYTRRRKTKQKHNTICAGHHYPQTNTTISTYHHYSSSNCAHCEVYLIKHYVIKFVSDLRQVGGFLRVLQFSPTNKTDRHEITEILLNVSLNTISMLYYVVGTVIQFSFAYHQYVACRSYLSGSNTSNHPPDRTVWLSETGQHMPLICVYRSHVFCSIDFPVSYNNALILNK
jgi:hypothetical protein